MLRTLALSILLCFVTFHIGLTANSDPSTIITPLIKPEPTQQSTTVQPSPSSTTTNTTTTTTKPSTTSATPTSPPTTTTPSSTTTSPITTTNATTTASTTSAPTTTKGPITTNSTTVAPITTAAPPPQPSDRKFDAFSFLGGFALGLGLVAIGFLSWKFYQSRQENYYHTL